MAKTLEMVHGRVASNDILGMAYLRALKDSAIQPIAIQRTNGYHDEDIQHAISSATAIRRAVKEKKPISHTTPMAEDLQEGVFMEDYYPYLQTLLLCTPAEELKKRFLVDEGMEHMLQGNARKHMDYGSFLQACITQRYPRSSIQRNRDRFRLSSDSKGASGNFSADNCRIRLCLPVIQTKGSHGQRAAQSHVHHIMTGLLTLVLLVVAANLILYHYFPTPPKPQSDRVYDVAIVLGSPAEEDGSLSRVQKTRMDAAITLYKEKRVRCILISGGSVRNTYTEADIMAAYAIRCSIPSAALLLERQAKNTYENLLYAKTLCDAHAWKHVIVVTSCFHVRRASYMVRKFFDDYVMQKTAEKEKCRHYITEYFRMWNSLRCELMLYRKRKR